MPNFLVYAPLNNFDWRGDVYPFAPGVDVIPRPSQPYPLGGTDRPLASCDRAELFFADHWLQLAWSSDESISDAEKVNLFLISLWLAQPTRTQVKFRFRVNTDPQDQEIGEHTRLFDQFQWIAGAVANTVADHNLAEAATYYPTLVSVRLSRLRLSNALYLTFAGCVSMQWQVALACFAGAAEALLTYKTGGGITKRLSRSFAVLVSARELDRDREYENFRKLYEKRSDVMHGRGHLISQDDRLPILAKFANALRLAWKAILASQGTVQALEGTDAQRKVFFEQLQGTWSPPQKCGNN